MAIPSNYPPPNPTKPHIFKDESSGYWCHTRAQGINSTADCRNLMAKYFCTERNKILDIIRNQTMSTTP